VIPNWGAVLVGGIAGLIGGIVVVGPPFLSGLVDTRTFGGQAFVTLVGFAAQVLAGAVAARVAGGRAALHGGLAGLVLVGVLSSFSYVAGRETSMGALAFVLAVGTILGAAGGVLVDSARRVGPD
jgi:hypothetical protein